MNTTTKNWIKATLSKFPFVEFDRYIDDTDDKLIEVFGWIKDDRWVEEFEKNFNDGAWDFRDKAPELFSDKMKRWIKIYFPNRHKEIKDFIRNIRKQDFIVLEFNLKTKKVYCVATSSAKYSKQISKILGEKHISCKKISSLK